VLKSDRLLGDGIALGARAFSGGNHLMYGRVSRFGRGGVFLGYTYPSPGVCYQYPEYYNLVQLVGSGDPIFACSGRERLAGFGPAKRLGEGLVKVGDEGLDPLLQIVL
jgi:hypothetical protein